MSFEIKQKDGKVPRTVKESVPIKRQSVETFG